MSKKHNQPPANSSAAPTSGAEAPTGAAESVTAAVENAAVENESVAVEPETAAGLSDAEKIADYEKVVAENARLKAAALDAAASSSFNSLTKELEPTDENAPVFEVQLRGNPKRYVRAASANDARDIYGAWFNIIASEHKATCEVCVDVPANCNPIHVVKDTEGNKRVCSLNSDGEHVVSEII